jgi:hypothetical protein
LPTAQRPFRVAEFDELLAVAVRGWSRPEPTAVRLELEPSATVAAKAADLMVRENACCSFFTFVLTVSGGELSLRVTVAADRTDVLDGLMAGVGR